MYLACSDYERLRASRLLHLQLPYSKLEGTHLPCVSGHVEVQSGAFRTCGRHKG